MIQSDKKNEYWRSVSELENTPEFEEMLHREFPVAASEFPKGLSRRRWLQLMGASFALGAAGCHFEQEKIAPFVQRPQSRTPGVPATYATTIEIAGEAHPLFVSNLDGRPIKLDGNPNHPESGGASDAFTQACILDLYDPDRAREVIYREGDRLEPKSWEEFETTFKEVLVAAKDGSGKGLCILAQPSKSPTVHRLKDGLKKAMPEMKWFEYASLTDENSVLGTKEAFGKALVPQYQFDKAKVIVSLDADPLSDHGSALKNARGWAQGRDVDNGKMNRLYCVESQFSVTGMSADHRLPLRSDKLHSFIAALAKEVEARLGNGNPDVEKGTELTRELFLKALAQDLVANRNESLLVCGRCQSPAVHALVAAINEMLIEESTGVEDRTVNYIEAAFASETSYAESFAAFVAAVDAGEVETLLVLGGNPIYEAPVNSGAMGAINPTKIPNRIHLSYYDNETTSNCGWLVPMCHPLEAWGDSIIRDGSWGVSQPQIDPLFKSISPIEMLAMLLEIDAEGEENIGLTQVRKTAEENQFSPGNSGAWNKLIHDGFAANSAAAFADISKPEAKTDGIGDSWNDTSGEMDSGSLEVVFTSSSVFDGRFANNGWLQELPESVTKITWGNAAIVSVATAEKLGLAQDKIAKISVNGKEIAVPVFVQPGQAPGSIGLAVGYGRTKAGRVGGFAAADIEPVGVNVNGLRRPDSWFIASGASAQGTGQNYELAVTQDHFMIDAKGLEGIANRMIELVKEGSYESYQHFVEEQGEVEHHDESESDHEESEEKNDSEDDHEEHERGHGKPQWPVPHHHHFENFDLNPGPKYTEDNRWGMTIDLNSCTGCNGCVIACQSENNIPVVGIEQVRMGREMHWLRIDRYFSGVDTDNPRVVTQPVACHHCEKAPCETVCPVAATTHSKEGLNDMVYNRCIGTRYCGNNCPYKVRRFNYFNYTEAVTFIKYPWADKLSEANKQLQGLVMNPEVTVRSRGVMEKCTYCVQRIQNAKIQARFPDADPLGPNAITTACQDACPTNAIKFGDLSNEESDVAKSRASFRQYDMLGELNVLPRTSYLARVKNPHPSLPSPFDNEHDDHEDHDAAEVKEELETEA